MDIDLPPVETLGVQEKLDAYVHAKNSALAPNPVNFTNLKIQVDHGEITEWDIDPITHSVQESHPPKFDNPTFTAFVFAFLLMVVLTGIWKVISWLIGKIWK